MHIFYSADPVTADHQRELEVGFNYELLDDTFVLSEEEKSDTETEGEGGDDGEEDIQEEDIAKVEIEGDVDTVELVFQDPEDATKLLTYLVPKVPILHVSLICATITNKIQKLREHQLTHQEYG